MWTGLRWVGCDVYVCVRAACVQVLCLCLWDVGCGGAVMWAVGGMRCSVMCHAM